MAEVCRGVARHGVGVKCLTHAMSCRVSLEMMHSSQSLAAWEISRHSDPDKSSLHIRDRKGGFNAISASTEMKQTAIHSKFSTLTIGKATGFS